VRANQSAAGGDKIKWGALLTTLSKALSPVDTAWAVVPEPAKESGYRAIMVFKIADVLEAKPHKLFMGHNQIAYH